MDLETFGVIEAMSAGSLLFMFQGTENTLVPNVDQKMLLRSWRQLVCISNALLLSQRGRFSFGEGTLQQDVTKCCRGSGQPQTPFTLSLQHICPIMAALGEAGS